MRGITADSSPYDFTVPLFTQQKMPGLTSRHFCELLSLVIPLISFSLKELDDFDDHDHQNAHPQNNQPLVQVQF